MQLLDAVLLCLVCTCAGRRSRFAGTGEHADSYLSDSRYRTLYQDASRSGRDSLEELRLFLIRYTDSDSPPSGKRKGEGKGKGKGRCKDGHPSDVHSSTWLDRRAHKIMGLDEVQEEKELEKQPAFAGHWRSAQTVGLDQFLKESMGVSALKRKIALKAKQTQRVYQKSSVVHLEMTDRRGTAYYKIIPDGKMRAARGYRKLPIRQRAKWGSDGSLIVEERYNHYLGGDLHLKSCRSGKSPLIVSRRFVAKNGQMVVELERKMDSGKTLRTRSYFDPIKGRLATKKKSR